MLIVINDYLDSLKKAETKKPPPERRTVPSIEDLARAADISVSSYYKFAGNRARHINRDMLSATIKLLRACGFDTEITDLLIYVPHS